jgi:hypothetical protein
MLAIILTSVRDLIGTGTGKEWQDNKQRYRDCAKYFLFECETVKPFTLPHFCHIFDLDIEGVRVWADECILGLRELPQITNIVTGEVYTDTRNPSGGLNKGNEDPYWAWDHLVWYEILSNSSNPFRRKLTLSDMRRRGG